jgi:predicted DNA-binding transcriptional regulator AlpA
VSENRDEFLRVRQICNGPHGCARGLVDMSRAAWLHHVKNTPGWPQPIKPTPRTTLWSRQEIEEFLRNQRERAA